MISRTQLLLLATTFLLLECTYASVKTKNTKAVSTTSQPSVSKAVDSQSRTKRSVEVTNAISPKNLGYDYYFITYEPTLFTITVNDTVIKQSETKTVSLTGNTLTIVYYCEFKDGKRKSSKKFTYSLKPDTTAITLTFDWHRDPRITLSHGECIATETIAV